MNNQSLLFQLQLRHTTRSPLLNGLLTRLIRPLDEVNAFDCIGGTIVTECQEVNGFGGRHVAWRSKFPAGEGGGGCSSEFL